MTLKTKLKMKTTHIVDKFTYLSCQIESTGTSETESAQTDCCHAGLYEISRP